jgi:purine-binding chemotaxis protein CheW
VENQVVVFSLNNQMCGVDTSQVQEIIRCQDIVKVPDMPDFIDGIINLRGKVVPIVNLNMRFELGETKITDNTKIIVTNINDILTGFIVNDVTGILRFSEEEIENTPAILLNGKNPYLKGVGKKDDMLISMLDLGKILTEGEVKSVSNISEIATG